MKLNEFFSILEEVAPVALSDDFCREFKLYDNSGIILNCCRFVDGALFSLDFSQKAVNKAKAHGCNLIVTHHPAIYGGITKIDAEEGKTAAIADCLRSGISVISMHINFDVAPDGIDYYLMRGLGGADAKVMSSVNGGGYGRAYDVKPQSFFDFIKRANAEFTTERSIGYGNLDKKISRVASFCGAGCDGDAMEFAIGEGVDAFVSSDLKHHDIAYLLERGINVVALTHYAAECYGFKKIFLKIKDKVGIPCEFFTDADLI